MHRSPPLASHTQPPHSGQPFPCHPQQTHPGPNRKQHPQLSLATPDLPAAAVASIKEQVLDLRDQITRLQQTRSGVGDRRAAAITRTRGSEAALRAAYEARVAERQRLLARSALKVCGGVIVVVLVVVGLGCWFCMWWVWLLDRCQ